jgi:hypothetical protein
MLISLYRDNSQRVLRWQYQLDPQIPRKEIMDSMEIISLLQISGVAMNQAKIGSSTTSLNNTKATKSTQPTVQSNTLTTIKPIWHSLRRSTAENESRPSLWVYKYHQPICECIIAKHSDVVLVGISLTSSLSLSLKSRALSVHLIGSYFPGLGWWTHQPIGWHEDYWLK